MDEYGKPNNTRVTISAGTLIINNPHTVTDRGRYFCKASNYLNGREHKIRSQSVAIGKKHALKKYDQFPLAAFGEVYTSCAISRNFCYNNKIPE